MKKVAITFCTLAALTFNLPSASANCHLSTNAISAEAGSSTSIPVNVTVTNIDMADATTGYVTVEYVDENARIIYTYTTQSPIDVSSIQVGDTYSSDFDPDHPQEIIVFIVLTVIFVLAATAAY